MDYNARYYSPLLGRFVSPDTMIPDQSNSIDWDRYAYVRNSPINANDPSGNDPRPGQKGDYKQDPVIDPTYDWEAYVITAVIYAESSPHSGDYPTEWLEMIAWTYLNRTILVNDYLDNLLKAVRGQQSAVELILSGNGGWKIPAGLEGLSANPTLAETMNFFVQTVNLGLEGKYNSPGRTTGGDWKKCLEIAKKVYSSWSTYGTGSSQDPTANYVPGGATDFRMVVPPANEGFWQGPGWGAPTYPEFSSKSFGPVNMPHQMNPVQYLFISNKLYSKQRGIAQ